MIGLANLALVGGLVAVAAPILVHIAHRRRYRIARWGAMRFLVDLVAAQRRRLVLEHWVLLAVRCLAVACVALALCRPYWTLSEGGAGIERLGAVAAVVLIDDSPSASAGRDDETMDAIHNLADAYLDTLGNGDEISVITGSGRNAPAADPFFDGEAAREVVAQAGPTAVASSIPDLIEAGLAQLGRHINPHAEIVLVSDGYASGWNLPALERWRDLSQRFSGAAQDPRLVVVLPQHMPAGLNVAVTDLRSERSLIGVGTEVGIRVRVVCRGDQGNERVSLRLFIDGRQVGERQLDLPAGESRDEVFPCVFSDPGSHLVEARIDGARDLIAIDDQRSLSVQVEAGVEVLLVEGQVGRGSSGSLGLLATALDPEGDGAGLFRVRRTAAVDFGRDDLEGARVLVLGDVPALEPAAVAAIEAFVVAGGGVLVAPGPHTDLDLASRFWSRGGHGFLPASFAGIQDLRGSAVHIVDTSHSGLAAFADVDAQVWEHVRIRRIAQLGEEARRSSDIRTLIALDDGSPVLVLRRRGHGLVAQMATTLDDQWNDLPMQALYVPLVRGLAAELASVILPPRNLRPGEPLCWVPPAGFSGDPSATGPDGRGVALAEGTWEGRKAFFSPPLLDPGGYQLRAPGIDLTCAIATDPEEAGLTPLGPQDLRAILGDDLIIRRGPQAVAETFASERVRPVELWRWILGLGLALLVAEMLITARIPRATARPSP